MSQITCYIDNINSKIHIRNLQAVGEDIVRLRKRVNRDKSLCKEFHVSDLHIQVKNIDKEKLESQEDFAVCDICSQHLPNKITALHFDEKIQLNAKQKYEAYSAIKTLEREVGESLYEEYETFNEVNPDQLIDSWSKFESSPKRNLDSNEQTEKLVNVSKIKGSKLPNRLVPQRLEYILFKMIHDSWYRQYHSPVSIVKSKQGDEYFVDKDGNHRVIAYKIVDINSIYSSI